MNTKRLLILIAVTALIACSGCRNCGWWKRRGAPCRSSLSFDPYAGAPAAAAPAPAAGVCGVDAFAGQPVCGHDVTVGYGGACPHCQGTGAAAVGSGYYETAPLAPVPGGQVPGAVNFDPNITSPAIPTQ